MLQGKYIWDVLKKLNMMGYKLAKNQLEIELKLQRSENSHPIDNTPYCQSSRRLIYRTTTQPYISFDTIVILKFIQNPWLIH